MESAGDKRGKRLFSDLNSAFRRDPNIDEFDFIPVTEPTKNRSPIVVVDHKLGLELWSVKILYQYVYHTLMDWRSKKSSKFIDPKELVAFTRAAILLNPECYTFWNIRKELLESGDIPLNEDLKLGALVLTKHPKSSETFIHRRWVIQRFIDNHLQSSEGSNHSSSSNHDSYVCMDGIDLNLSSNSASLHNGEILIAAPHSEYHAQMKKEMIVCQFAAEKYPCNYYAWSYRIWLLQHCYNMSLHILLNELYSTDKWINNHISDHCGFHYRQFLLDSLGKQSNTLLEQYTIQLKDLLMKELRITQDLIAAYPAHEAMWSHRKFVFQSSYVMSCLNSTDAGDALGCQQKKTRLENEQTILEQNEIECVTKLDLGSRNVFHKKLAENYLDWIRKTVKRQ